MANSPIILKPDGHFCPKLEKNASGKLAKSNGHFNVVLGCCTYCLILQISVNNVLSPWLTTVQTLTTEHKKSNVI